QVCHEDHIEDDDSHPSRTQGSIEVLLKEDLLKRLPSTPEPVELAEPTKRRVLRNPTKTYFVAWKDADGFLVIKAPRGLFYYEMLWRSRSICERSRACAFVLIADH
ncbi:hypothetical protein FOZ62_021458, partial [Perkinsus olseni]